MAVILQIALLLATASLIYSAPIVTRKSINAGSIVRILDWTHGRFVGSTAEDTLTLERRHGPNTCFRLLQHSDSSATLETLQDRKVLKISEDGRVFVNNGLEQPIPEVSGSGNTEGSTTPQAAVYEKLTAAVGFEHRVIRAQRNPACSLRYEARQRVFTACNGDPDTFLVLRAPDCTRWI